MKSKSLGYLSSWYKWITFSCVIFSKFKSWERTPALLTNAVDTLNVH